MSATSGHMVWKDKRIAVRDVKEGPRMDAEGVRDGWDATTDIRDYEQAKNLAAIPIIGMTAHAYIEDQKNCLRVGMNDYISKPYTADEIVSKIRAHLKS